MKEIIEAISGLVMLVVVGNLSSDLYSFVRKEALLKVQKGTVSLVQLNQQLTGQRFDYYPKR